MSGTARASGPVLPVSAIACYNADSGTLLGMARVRLIETLPTSVGRHAAFDPHADANSNVRHELQWRPSPELSVPVASALADLMAELGRVPLDRILLEAIVTGEIPFPRAGFATGTLVFLECSAWERPRPMLVEALRAQALHGTPIRADLRVRYAAALVA